MLNSDIENSFRHEYGSLVAVLCKKLGNHNIDDIEDAVQHALMQGLESWKTKGKPKETSAWLYRVAYNQLISQIRKSKRQQEILDIEFADKLIDINFFNASNSPKLKSELKDALLHMLFIACHESIPLESQLVFVLKILCGFSLNEISSLLFISEANVYKRYSRAKNKLKELNLEFEKLTDQHISNRLPTALKILYLTFTEGYFSSNGQESIRKDLCLEAMHLVNELTQFKFTQAPETYALYALMNLHMARFDSRKNDQGTLLLLEEQDRNKYDQSLILIGVQLLEQAACGNKLSRYHLEASIAYEHCSATSINNTRWDRIIKTYELLERISTTPLHSLNRVIAISEWHGAHEALDAFDSLTPPLWLLQSYHWYAVKADLLFKTSQNQQGKDAAIQATELASSENIKRLLNCRFAKYN